MKFPRGSSKPTMEYNIMTAQMKKIKRKKNLRLNIIMFIISALSWIVTILIIAFIFRFVLSL